jgi:septal ring factor EnvC (AmiA/AmiB activator)
MISLADVLSEALGRPGKGVVVDREQLVQARDEIARLQAALEKNKETMEALELTIATLRRRVESLEGVVNP